MSYIVKLQVNNSEKNKLTKKITTIKEVEGTQKDESSIIDPVFLVASTMSDLRTCNYITVNNYERSYFVTDITTVQQGIVRLTCHVDVLSSFAGAIRKNEGIIRKQEKNWNLYLNDGSLRTYQNPNVLTRAFPNGFTTQQFVLAVAGN